MASTGRSSQTPQQEWALDTKSEYGKCFESTSHDVHVVQRSIANLSYLPSVLLTLPLYPLLLFIMCTFTCVGVAGISGADARAAAGWIAIRLADRLSSSRCTQSSTCSAVCVPCDGNPSSAANTGGGGTGRIEEVMMR